MMEGLWGFVIIGGPILLGLAILWGVVTRRKRSEAPVAQTEAATTRMYDQQSAQDQAMSGD